MSILKDRTVWVKQAGKGKLWHFPHRREGKHLFTLCEQRWHRNQVAFEGIPQDGAGICRRCEHLALKNTCNLELQV